jgi:hypothetical protein
MIMQTEHVQAYIFWGLDVTSELLKIASGLIVLSSRQRDPKRFVAIVGHDPATFAIIYARRRTRGRASRAPSFARSLAE